MRVAVISDIHGNAHALEAVLADIDRQAPDLTLNLGDHLSGPFNCAWAADMLIPRGFPSISGNHDRWLVASDEKQHGRLEKIARQTLTKAHLDWVENLPPTRVIEDEIFMCHATPADDLTNWLDDFNELGQVVLQPKAHIEAHAKDINYPVILCGHTHVPRVVQLSGGRIVVNPGSVGYPGFAFDRDGTHFAWNAGAPHASYAILEKGLAGWSVTLRAVPYDFEAAAREADEAGVVAVASALRTGWLPD